MSADLELPPLDPRVFLRLHGNGVEVLSAYVRNERLLRAQQERAQLEPQVVIRNFGKTPITVR